LEQQLFRNNNNYHYCDFDMQENNVGNPRATTKLRIQT